MSGNILRTQVESATGRELADMSMSKHICDVLTRHYPGHMWAVQTDSANGVATVMNMRLSGKWGFLLKLPAIYSASEFDRQIMLAGGELLERYQLHAGRFIQGQYDSALSNGLQVSL